jgi:hypothetical protein
MLVSFRRAAQAVLKSWLEIVIAVALIYYDLRLFCLYCFLWNIFISAFKHDYMRSLTRTYNVGMECKLLVIMNKLGIEHDEVGDMYETLTNALPEKQRAGLKDDAAVIGLW